MRKNQKLSFDVMLNGKYIRTYEINQGPFIIQESEIREFVEERLPSLKGKKYNIEINH